MIKVVLVSIALVFPQYLYSSSPGADQEKEDEPVPVTLSREQLDSAQASFKERCARCHGADGHGQTVLGGMLGVPDFTDAKWWKEEKSDKRLTESITDGKGDMPAFGKKMTKQQIALLIAYVRRFYKSPQ
jgi:mono/diheme cytochrome c family protein